MNYLTTYYKNLSEQLQEQINHLSKLLNEAVLDRGGMEVDYNNMVDPPANKPSQTPPTETPPTETIPERGGPVPKDPGEAPVRRPGESESDYQKRFEEYVRLKNAYKEYKVRCPTPCTGVWVYPNPKHPRDQKGWKGGDTYIDGSGQMWRYGDGKWTKEPARVTQKPKGADGFFNQ